jgi:hypothetical protein
MERPNGVLNRKGRIVLNEGSDSMLLIERIFVALKEIAPLIEMNGGKDELKPCKP